MKRYELSGENIRKVLTVGQRYENMKKVLQELMIQHRLTAQL